MFVESQNDPETDPLILWLNGGPGCSSMTGFLYEHGPYIFPLESVNLTQNIYSWNTNASVIYLDAPAGVGFSVAGDQANYSTNDTITAHDNLQALLQWYQKFEEYSENDLYIIGESYAGIYVPTLAMNVLLYNEEEVGIPINLVGIGVGNGLTDWYVDTNWALIQMGWSHNLYWTDTKAEFDHDCENGQIWSNQCQNDVNNFTAVLMNNMNIYDLYRDCIHPITESPRYIRKWHSAFSQSHTKLRDIPPCADSIGIMTYLTENAVRTAFNIPASVQAFDFCSDDVEAGYEMDFTGSLYTYPLLISSGLKILIYTGDTDGAVAFPGTRAWIASLDLAMIQDHTAWYLNNQVAGYVEVYNGLQFVSVKGVGHVVPQWAPAQAHSILSHFLFDLAWNQEVF